MRKNRPARAQRQHPRRRGGNRRRLCILLCGQDAQALASVPSGPNDRPVDLTLTTLGKTKATALSAIDQEGEIGQIFIGGVYSHAFRKAPVLATASGGRTQSEAHGYGQNEFVPWQVGAVM